jgi:hypothetical protein
MPLSSFGQITLSLSLKDTSLAIPFLRLTSQFHKKTNGIYIYKMGTEDEVSIHMPKAPRDRDDFFELAMAVSKHKLFHGHYVFVEHDIKTDLAKFGEDDKQILENINISLSNAEIKYRKTMTVIEESYQLKTDDLINKFKATTDTDEAIKAFRVAHDVVSDEKERLIAQEKIQRDLDVQRLYHASEHLFKHSDANRASYTNEEWYIKSEQDFVEKFNEFNLHAERIIKERRAIALEKMLQKKTNQFVENLLIDAAIAGHKTAYQHLKLEDLNCKDGIKLKMVKKFKTIDEMKMLLWDLKKYGASSTYYWLKNPQQVNDLQQGLQRLIDAHKAHENQCAQEEMLKEPQTDLSEIDLKKRAIHDDEVNEEVAKIPLSQQDVRSRRAETAHEANRINENTPDESVHRPHSMF